MSTQNFSRNNSKGGRFLSAGPKIHVFGGKFEGELEATAEAGFRKESEPRIALSRAVLFVK